MKRSKSKSARNHKNQSLVESLEQRMLLAALTVSNVALTSIVNEGGTAALSGDISAPNPASTFALTVNWGEGTPQVYNLPAGSTSFSVTHQYADDNPIATPSDTYSVTGTLRDDDGGSAALLGRGPSGSLDVTFGASGKVLTPVGSTEDDAYALVIQSDGKLVAAGRSLIGSTYDFALARYNPDGTLDSGFGSGGKVLTPIGSISAYANALAVQPDGKLVAAGYAHNGSNFDFALVRYNANGTLDSGFGSGGKVLTPIGSSWDYAYALTIQPDGKLVVAGRSSNGSNDDFALARYNTNGTLDSSFGSAGKVIISIGSGDECIYDVAVQSDGKLVAAGYSSNGSNLDFALVRYNTNGTLDSSFGAGGKVITPVGSSDEIACALAIQSDGKLVAAGSTSSTSTYYDFVLVRYNADGSLDNSFGAGGKALTDIGEHSDDFGRDLAIQSDGKLVAVGYRASASSNGYDLALARYNSDGTLDSNFGTGGRVVTPIGSAADQAFALAIQSDGKLVAAGLSYSGSYADFALVRYNASGLSLSVNNVAPLVNAGSNQTLDPASAGHLTRTGSFTDPGADTWSGTVNYGDGSGVQPLVINATTKTFALDHTYGTSGSYAVSVTLTDDDLGSGTALFQVTVNVGGPPMANSGGPYSVNEGASIALSGSASAAAGLSISAYEWDLNYDGQGFQVDATGRTPSFSAASLDGPATRTIGLRVKDTASTYSAIATVPVTINNVGPVVSNVTLTPSVNEGGTATLSGTIFDVPSDSFTLTVNWGAGIPQVYNLAPGSTSFSVTHQYADDNPTSTVSDRYLVSSTFSDDDGATVSLGIVDTSFGVGGIAITDFNGRDDRGQSVVVQPDGKTLLGGLAYNTSGTRDFALARYSANGTLDSTFGVGGRVTTDLAGGDDYGQSLAVQADGKVLLAGYALNPVSGTNDFAVVRYNANGTLDYSFGVAGKVLTPIGSADEEAYALVIQSDAKFVAAGHSYNGSNWDFALVRYNPDGSLDNSFGNGGKVLTPVGGNNDFANALAMQPDGKLLAAGSSVNGGNYDDFALVRYNADGSLDSSFGSGGKVVTSISVANYDFANALAIQPDGKLVAAGQSNNVSNWNFSLVRYNANGSLDSSFGTGGKVMTSMGTTFAGANALAVQSDGKLVAAGHSADSSYTDFALARYNANGTLDSSFGNGGKAITPIGRSSDYINALAIQPDGNLVAAGFTNNGSNLDFALVRYNASGLSLSVNNVAPLVNAGSNQTLDPASAGHLTRTGSFTDPGADTWSGTVNYGDGSGVQPLVINATTKTFALDHTYGTSGSYAVSVTLTDDDLGSGTALFQVTVNPPAAPVKLTGTILGTPGSFANSGNTRDKALDGNTATYFDAPIATGAWVGLDLGSAKSLSKVRYYPRASQPARMVGGKFQGSNDPSFTSGVVDLATITTLPPLAWTELAVANATPFRYVRYLSPTNSWGNVAEIEFYGTGGVPNAAPNTPGNALPINGATNQSLTPTLASGAFSDPDAGDSQAAAQWLVRRSSDGVTVFDSGTDAVWKTTCPVPTGKLAYSTGYSWQVRYQDNHGAWSGYSSATSFTTLAAPADQPPVVNTFTPTPGTLTLGQSTSLAATASDPDAGDSITAVKFFEGSTLLGNGSLVSGQWSFNWNTTGHTAGSFTLSAIAYDSNATPSPARTAGVTINPAASDAKLTGTIIGTAGSYDGTSTRDKALDGNTSTYFDAPSANANNAWVGYDLLSGYQITRVRYYPRANWASRMLGGKFQGSNDPSFASGVADLATITATPPYAWSQLTVSDTASFRYVRYLSPLRRIWQCGGGGVLRQLPGSPTPRRTPPATPCRSMAPPISL